MPTFSDPEKAVVAGLTSGITKRRKEALENLPEAEKNEVAFEIYNRVQKECLRKNKFCITPGLNKATFMSNPYRLTNVSTGGVCGGAYPELIFEILKAGDSVLTERAGLVK